MSETPVGITEMRGVYIEYEWQWYGESSFIDNGQISTLHHHTPLRPGLHAHWV